MRFLPALLLSLFASLGCAQTLPDLPPCAGDCITAGNYGGCGTLKIHCICSNKPYLAGLSCCISKNCSPAEQQHVIQLADALCQGYGVTSLPTAATCASTASSTGTTSSTSSASSQNTNAASAGRLGEGGVGLGLLMAGLAVAL